MHFFRSGACIPVDSTAVEIAVRECDIAFRIIDSSGLCRTRHSMGHSVELEDDRSDTMSLVAMVAQRGALNSFACDVIKCALTELCLDFSFHLISSTYL